MLRTLLVMTLLMCLQQQVGMYAELYPPANEQIQERNPALCSQGKLVMSSQEPNQDTLH